MNFDLVWTWEEWYILLRCTFMSMGGEGKGGVERNEKKKARRDEMIVTIEPSILLASMQAMRLFPLSTCILYIDDSNEERE